AVLTTTAPDEGLLQQSDGKAHRRREQVGVRGGSGRTQREGCRAVPEPGRSAPRRSWIWLEPACSRQADREIAADAKEKQKPALASRCLAACSDRRTGRRGNVGLHPQPAR